MLRPSSCLRSKKREVHRAEPRTLVPGTQAVLLPACMWDTLRARRMDGEAAAHRHGSPAQLLSCLPGPTLCPQQASAMPLPFPAAVSSSRLAGWHVEAGDAT